MENLKSKGIKAFIWDFFGKMATQGMGFIISIFLARLLEPSDFGLIAIVAVIIGVASVFTDIGLSGALVQRRKLLSVHYSSAFYFNIFVGSILTLLTYFSAKWVSNFYRNDDLMSLVQIMSLSFIINAFSSVQTTKLQKELNYAVLAKANFMAALTSGCVGIALAFHYSAGVWSLVAQTLSRGLFYNILIWSASEWIPTLSFSFKALKQLWGFGFRMFLSGLLDAVFTRLDSLIIGKLFLPATLGFFERAKSLNAMVVQYSSGSLMAVLFPILSKIQNDLPRFQNIVIKAMGVICFIVFLLVGGLYLVSGELVSFLFGEKWLPSVSYFQILLFSGFAYPVSALLVNVLSSRGNSKAFLRLEIYKKFLLCFNFFSLYLWGITIYLYSLIATSILTVLLNILFASREIKLSIYKFIELLLDQAIIAVLVVVTTSYLAGLMKMDSIWLFISKGLFFSLMYFMISWLLKTKSYCSFAEQIKQKL